MITFNTIVSYLENLGAQHVDIATTFRWNKSQLTGQLRQGIPLSIMLIDSPETQTEFPNNKTFHNHNCAITIIGKPGINTTKIDNYAAQNEVLDHCQRICFEIESRIKHDGSTGAVPWLRGLVVKDSFHFFKAGPIFSDAYYGYRCEFNIKSKASCAVNVTKWADMP